MRTNEHRKKPVILNSDGNYYYFNSITDCAKYLNLSYVYIWKLLNGKSSKCYDNFRIKLEYYDETKHNNIKEYMSI